jgi:hypothetical protein
MRMRVWWLAATVMLVATSTAFAADNPWVGKWKMDPAQSKLTGDTIHFASAADGEVTYTEEGHPSKFKVDGQPYKTWDGSEATWKKVDDNTFQQHLKRNDIDLATNTWTISQDGKTLKVESKGKTLDGTSFDDTSEFARVSGTKGLLGGWKSTKTHISDPEVWNITEKGANELQWEIPAIKGTLDATLDGKDHAPVGPTVPKGLTIAVTRVSPRVLKVTSKMNGEVTDQSTMTISPDGKKIVDVSTPVKTKETTTVVWVKQ